MGGWGKGETDERSGWVESFESAELGLGEWECGVDVSFPFFFLCARREGD